jgi:hypothetical protein
MLPSFDHLVQKWIVSINLQIRGGPLRKARGGGISDMKALLTMTLRLLLVATAMTAADCASAAPGAGAGVCRSYGFVPHSRDYAVCLMNVRHYWTAGPCGDAQFAAAHPRYCHLIRTFDF